MTEQQKKYKEIAVAFSVYFVNKTPMNFPTEAHALEIYESWLLTEEGKRLTAEEAEKESSYELLLKISKQLDRFEGRLTVSSDDIKNVHHRITNRNE